MNWRPITSADREVYLCMATAFYESDAVLHPIPTAHLTATFDEMMRSDVYAVGFICEAEGETAGYALLAKTFSQEAGGMVWWVEELYIEEAFRGRGMGKAFLSGLLSALPGKVKRVRLETEKENHRAVKLYESLGFSFLAYDPMIWGN